MERIQKLIAQTGIASRRNAEELIRQGRVHVNGKDAKLGDQASTNDTITVDGKKITFKQFAYYALHKPPGYITTLEPGTHTLPALIKKNNIKERIYPAGRLDKDAEGLLILTNDGAFANTIMHPRYELTKEYHATLNKPFVDSKTVLKDTRIDGRTIAITNITIAGKHVRLTIHEGRKHIVKRIFKQLNYTVTNLQRTRIGPVLLGDLAPGKARLLTTREINTIKRTQD